MCRLCISGREEINPEIWFIEMRRVRISMGHGKPHPPSLEGQMIRFASVSSADGEAGGLRPIDLIASDVISLRRSKRNSSRGSPSCKDHMIVGINTKATPSRRTGSVGEVVWQSILNRVTYFCSFIRCSDQYPPGASFLNVLWKITPRYRTGSVGFSVVRVCFWNTPFALSAYTDRVWLGLRGGGCKRISLSSGAHRTGCMLERLLE